MEKHNIDDSVPTEDEVETAVKKLQRNRAGGPLGIRAENIKGWLAAARRGGKAEEKGKTKTAAEEERASAGRKGSVAVDVGVVQGSSDERSAARSSYARADHGGPNETVSPGTVPGGEYTDTRGNDQHRRLGTYGGRG